MSNKRGQQTGPPTTAEDFQSLIAEGWQAKDEYGKSYTVYSDSEILSKLETVYDRRWGRADKETDTYYLGGSVERLLQRVGAKALVNGCFYDYSYGLEEVFMVGRLEKGYDPNGTRAKFEFVKNEPRKAWFSKALAQKNEERRRAEEVAEKEKIRQEEEFQRKQAEIRARVNAAAEDSRRKGEAKDREVIIGPPELQRADPPPLRSRRGKSGKGASVTVSISLTQKQLPSKVVKVKQAEGTLEKQEVKIGAASTPASSEISYEEAEKLRAEANRRVFEGMNGTPPPPLSGQLSGSIKQRDLEKQAAQDIRTWRESEGMRRINLTSRERDYVAEGVRKGKGILKAIALAVAAAATQAYSEATPARVAKTDPIGVEAKEVGGTFTLRVTGGPEAQMWARILEDGTENPVDMAKVARFSPKRKAVQIYRAKKGAGGKLILRSRDERVPGYYLTVPFVYGKAKMTADGKIDVSEVFKRKVYNASGEQREVSLTPTGNASDRTMRRQEAVLKGWMQVPLGAQEGGRSNELAEDPNSAYVGGKYLEKQREYDMDSIQYDTQKVDAAPTGRGPGRIITQDGENDRMLISQRGDYRGLKPDEKGSQKKIVTGEDGKMNIVETAQSQDMKTKLGGAVHFRPNESGEGDIVRFRRISTRTGKTMMIPANPRLAKHIIRNARAEYTRQVSEEIAALQTRLASQKNSGSIKDKAVLSTLNAGRMMA